jgi:uncharacterized protein YbjT (DUF2867 family)
MTTVMTTLVTGATGVIGRTVVAQLLEAGVPVRALTRDPDGARLPQAASVVRGDLADPATLEPALQDAGRMFLLALPQTAREVVARARAAGVRRIVVLSAGAVTHGMDTEFHRPVELAVEESGLEWTHVRPGEFAYNKVLLWGPSIRAERVVRHPDPERLRACPLHEQDVAAVAVSALLRDGHAGKAYTFTGPGRLSLREQVQAIAAALGEPIHFEDVSPEEALRRAREHGGRTREAAEVMLGFITLYAPRPGAPAPAAIQDALPDPGQITGQPARSFQQWARDHVADFR